MRAQLLCAFGIASLVSVSAAQGPGTSSNAATQKNGSKSITLGGCVAAERASAGHFTLDDFTSGTTTYRLSGADVRRYLGKRVELVGSAADPKLKIVGGLTPSPNIAAQAGAVDQTQAAMAAQGAQGNARPGNIEVPELRVKAVKAVVGDCNHR